MDSLRARAFVVVWAAGFAACHHGLKSPKGDPIPRDAYIDTSVSEVCAALATCCSLRGFRFNAEVCTSNFRKFRYFGDEYCPSPGLYDAQAAGDCLAEQKVALSTCALDPRPTSESCRHICTGTLPVGQACTNATDCAPGEAEGSYCYPFFEPGRCIPSTRGRAGDSCRSDRVQSAYGDWGEIFSEPKNGEEDWVECHSEDGLYCARDGSSFSCQPFLGIGKACDDSLRTLRNRQRVDGVLTGDGQVCAPELYCDESRFCVARKRTGEACTYDDECLDFACGSATGRCLPAGVQDITAEFCADPL